MCIYESCEGKDMKYKFGDRVAWVDDENEFLLINYETEKVAIFRSVGADIVRSISLNEDLENIFKSILRQYDEDPSLIKEDIESFVSELVEKGYVVLQNK